jgi:hypothetical protein
VLVKYALPAAISLTRFTNSTSVRSRRSMNVLITIPAPPAVGDLLERLARARRVEPHRVLVDHPVGQRQRRRLAVGDHHDLAHVLLLRHQDAGARA